MFILPVVFDYLTPEETPILNFRFLALLLRFTTFRISNANMPISQMSHNISASYFLGPFRTNFRKPSF